MHVSHTPPHKDLGCISTTSWCCPACLHRSLSIPLTPTDCISHSVPSWVLFPSILSQGQGYQYCSSNRCHSHPVSAGQQSSGQHLPHCWAIPGIRNAMDSLFVSSFPPSYAMSQFKCPHLKYLRVHLTSLPLLNLLFSVYILLLARPAQRLCRAPFEGAGLLNSQWEVYEIWVILI